MINLPAAGCHAGTANQPNRSGSQAMTWPFCLIPSPALLPIRIEDLFYEALHWLNAMSALFVNLLVFSEFHDLSHFLSTSRICISRFPYYFKDNLFVCFYLT
jgi:hypothetical protein